MLHVMNGDAAGDTLRRSNVGGTILTYADVLYDGRVPSEHGEAFREARASHERDAALEGFRRHDEVVLWFEHDLYDQLLLIRHLDWFSRRDPGSTKLSLICIGAFPGIEPFHGLGQLDARQLTSLLPSRAPVTSAQFDLGTRAWTAFTGSDPRAIERLIASGTQALPFLDGALRRHLQEFPSVASGLPRTERQALEALADGSRSRHALFTATQRREERVFMGDLSFWWRLDVLAAGTTPLITNQNGDVAITAAGRDVLAGRADWMALAPFDRWLGGVHLMSKGRMWRWDESRKSIVESQ